MGLLDGKITMVTGGARGIGLATVERLAREGATVLAVDLDEETQAREGRASLGPDFASRRRGAMSATAPDEDVDASVRRFGHVQYMLQRIPLGRAGQPTEVAALIAWVASDEASSASTSAAGAPRTK